jgi:hypothetical protein
MALYVLIKHNGCSNEFDDYFIDTDVFLGNQAYTDREKAIRKMDEIIIHSAYKIYDQFKRNQPENFNKEFIECNSCSFIDTFGDTINDITIDLYEIQENGKIKIILTKIFVDETSCFCVDKPCAVGIGGMKTGFSITTKTKNKGIENREYFYIDKNRIITKVEAEGLSSVIEYFN